MSAPKFFVDTYEIDTSPNILPDGRFVARAVITRSTEEMREEIWPDFEPFATEAEASAAAHLAAVAWTSHRG